MTAAELKHYHFQTPQQWQAGLSDRLEITASGLLSAGTIESQPLLGTSAIDATPALSVNPCGDLYWVRQQSLELVRLMPNGVLVLGKLSVVGYTSSASTKQAKALACGMHQLWLCIEAGGTGGPSRQLFVYDSNDLQLLDELEFKRDILAICSDAEEGVWIILGGDSDPASIVHIDAGSHRVQQIDYPGSLYDAKIAYLADTKQIVIFDAQPTPGNHSPPPPVWQLTLIDLCAEAEPADSMQVIYAAPRQSEVFNASLMAVDSQHHIHLMSAATGELWTLSLSGEVIAQFAQTLPAAIFSGNPALLTGLCANPLTAALVVATPLGLMALQHNTLSSIEDDKLPSYITPVLVSPDGLPGGWLRMDIAVELSPNAAIEVSVASAPEGSTVIDQAASISNNTSVPAALRLAQLNTLLNWQDPQQRVYRGGVSSNGGYCPQRILRFPLHDIADTHIWLRLRARATEGEAAPRIRQLNVYYPNISLLRYLPAVYQENKAQSSVLRNILAVFESVHGDLDSHLDRLPENIDPQSAADDWLPFLLQWLGLPPATEVASAMQRTLLQNAPYLLQARGTHAGLQALLKILLGDHFFIADLSAYANPWILPASIQANAFSARLGCQTLVLTPKTPPAFRLGSEAVLGQQGLRYDAVDAGELLSRRKGLIEIYIDRNSSGQSSALQALLQRYLRFFIPAHCRYRLHFVANTELQGMNKLDATLQVQSPGVLQLGQNSQLGNMSLKPDGRRRMGRAFGSAGMTLSTSTRLDVDSIL